MTEVICKKMIFLQQELETKLDVIRLIACHAKQNDLISDTEFFFQKVIAREEEVSTAIGYQIAIPHGKSEVVKQPFIGFLQTKKEFLWSEEQTEKVKLIFLIGVPEISETNVHLKFISQVSKKLLDESFRASLLQTTQLQEAYELLSSINKK